MLLSNYLVIKLLCFATNILYNLITVMTVIQGRGTSVWNHIDGKWLNDITIKQFFILPRDP